MKNNYYSLQLHVHGRFIQVGAFWSNPGDYTAEELEEFFLHYFKYYYQKIFKEGVTINSVEVDDYTKSVFINYTTVSDSRYVTYKEKFYFKYMFIFQNEKPVYKLNKLADVQLYEN